MAKIITEQMIEDNAIELAKKYSYYDFINCFTCDPNSLNDGTNRKSKKQVVLPTVLLESLKRINPQIPEHILNDIIDNISKTSTQSELIGENYSNYNKLLNNIPVEYDVDGKKKQDFVRLIAFNNPELNDYTICSQFWIKGQTYFRRPDLILFINGLPLVFIELKNSDIKVKSAYDKNLKDYLRDIPQLFYWNQICVLSNGLETRLGSFLSSYEHFFEWLKIESEKEEVDRKKIKEDGISLEYLINGLFDRERLLDYIENFIVFDNKQVKIIAKNHQFLGVNSAIANFEKKSELDGKLGVFWHTQGSGKSYSMAFFVRKINRKYRGNYTFLMITDRTDLNGQLFKTFLRTEIVTEKDNAQPKDANQLREYLGSNKPFIFTLIHKFRHDKSKKYPVLSERDNIIVLVDEAHRTQYKNLADNMRKGIPNAQFIAFTGTPLLGSKRLTNQWFGDYVSEYNFAQSIEDGATVPLYYSKRVPKVGLININLDDDFIDIVEKEDLNDDEEKHLEKYYAREMEVLKRDDRLEIIAKDIVYHFINRGYLGKAMVVSVDKFTAVKMYDKVEYYWKEKIKELNKQIFKESDPEKRKKLKDKIDYMNWVEMAVVVSKQDGEEEKFLKANLDITKHRKRLNSIDEKGADIEDNFKSPENPLSLVFVCAMWLTGFDVPTVSTIYLDKPMKGHTLMQAIARANRVFPGKTSGLVVDYLNIFKHMKRALSDYAISEDSEEMPVKDVESLKNLLEKTIEECVNYCESLEIKLTELIKENTTFDKLDLFKSCANKILQNDEVKVQFRMYANLSKNLYEASKPEIFNLDFDNRLLQAIIYLSGIISGNISEEKIENARSRMDGILDQSVEADNKNSFVAEQKSKYEIKTNKEISLIDLDINKIESKIKKSPYKNLEINELRQFIEEMIEKMLNRNVTRSKFSEMYKSIIDRYNSGASLNENYYEELLKFMEKMKKEEERHIVEGLSEEELELYDLLKKENLTKAEEQKVKLSAVELYKTITNKQSKILVIDWFKDEQPKRKVYSSIQNILNQNLPESYDVQAFREKTETIYTHILDKAITGSAYMVG